MGFYIDPTDMTKAAWFDKNVQRHVGRVAPAHHYLKDDGLVACVLVDNGMFNALGICFCQRELEAFARNDGRGVVTGKQIGRAHV